MDLYTDCFYENREEAIDSRVELISEASLETLHDMLEDVWTSHEGKVCSLVNWERFTSLQQAQVSRFGMSSYFAIVWEYVSLYLDVFLRCFPLIICEMVN